MSNGDVRRNEMCSEWNVKALCLGDEQKEDSRKIDLGRGQTFVSEDVVVQIKWAPILFQILLQTNRLRSMFTNVTSTIFCRENILSDGLNNSSFDTRHNESRNSSKASLDNDRLFA